MKKREAKISNIPFPVTIKFHTEVFYLMIVRFNNDTSLMQNHVAYPTFMITTDFAINEPDASTTAAPWSFYHNLMVFLKHLADLILFHTNSRYLDDI